MATDLHQFLESANLLGYKNALLEQGADDLQQLKDLCDGEFRQLCEMVGMDKKPFHMMRFRKTLDKYSSGNSSNPQLAPSIAVLLSTQTNSNSSSISQATPQQSTSGVATSSPSVALVDPSTSSAGLGSPPMGGYNSPPLQIDAILEGQLFLPPYLQPGSECRSFEDLIDNQTPIQRELGPCPFTPKIWDEKRKHIIRKYCTIYGKNADKRQTELSDFEGNINEASFQLCLRDPTLLVRRDELYLLSKRALKEGGYPYHHGFSKAKKCENPESSLVSGMDMDQKRPLEAATASIEIPAQTKRVKLDKLISDSMQKPHKPFCRLSSERLSEGKRKQLIGEVGMKISTNKLHQSSKLALLKKAHEQGDHGTAYHVQMELEALGTECMKLQAEYSLLKKKQRRSERYYSLKEKQEEQLLRGDFESLGGPPSEQDCSIPSESNLTRQVVDIMYTSAANTPFDNSNSQAALSSAPFVDSAHHQQSTARKPINTAQSEGTAKDHGLTLEFEREKTPIFPQQLPSRSGHSSISPIRKRPTVTATILPAPTTQTGQQQHSTAVQVSILDKTSIASTSTTTSPLQISHLQGQSSNSQLPIAKQQTLNGVMDVSSDAMRSTSSSSDDMHALMIDDFQKQLNWNLK